MFPSEYGILPFNRRDESSKLFTFPLSSQTIPSQEVQQSKLELQFRGLKDDKTDSANFKSACSSCRLQACWYEPETEYNSNMKRR
ncbi:hypothetical protein KSS87_000392 [Heliosperma pusillum]|nr:hypothetical protein KSS87_000392 [Heliosperma pusillum]